MNDEITTFALEDIKRIDFFDDYIWFNCSSNVFNLFWPIDYVKKITYSDRLDAGGIELNEDELSPDFQIKKDELIFSNLKENALITIYGLNGNLILKRKVNAGGVYKYSTGDLEKGVYIINVDGVTFKILK